MNEPPRNQKPVPSAADRRLQEIRQRLQQERGLTGVARFELLRRYMRLKARLFGRQAARRGWLRSGLTRLFTPFRRLKRAGRRSRALVALAAVALAGAVVFGLFERPDTAKDTQAADTSTRLAAPQPNNLPRGDPAFATLTPAGKDIVELGGWARISPPDRDPVYAYTDRIGEIPISVSQQPLPKNLKNGDITHLAKDYSATKKLEVPGTEAYLGNSAKGPQSVITSKQDLLILLKSTAPLTDQQWIDYLTSLR